MYAHLDTDATEHQVTLHARRSAQALLEVGGVSVRTVLDAEGNYWIFCHKPQSAATLLARGNLFGEQGPPGPGWRNYGLEREGEGR